MREPIPVFLPPGFYGNGTPYSALGRFSTGDLVRFRNGFVRPLGGWRRRRDEDGVIIPPLWADPDVEAARGIIAWRDTAGASHVVVGTNQGLYHVSVAGVVTSISPAGFAGAPKDPTLVLGFGVSRYGQQAYGTPRSGIGYVAAPVSSWSFSLFGDVLLAQYRDDGPLYRWQSGVDAIAVAVAGAPTDAQAVLVTTERIAMTIKTQPRLVEWSDSEDFTTWTPAVTNRAGSQTLAGSGDLKAIVQVGKEILIISTKDAHVGRFLGAPFVYGFDQVGEGCGTIAANSVVELGGKVYWASQGGFWTYDGAVRKLDSEIDDWWADKVDTEATTKTFGFALPTYREVWWFFQSKEQPECDTYVIYNYEDGTWAYGSLPRTVGIAQDPANTSIYVGWDGTLWDHDLEGTNIPEGYQAFAETGPLELGQGGQIMGVQQVFPDLTPDPASPDGAAARLEILGKDWPSPNEPERVYGPYDLDRPISTTGARGREIRLRYIGTGRRWRGGKQRMLVTPVGGR